MGQLSLYFNPCCSKCRTAQGLLAEREIDAHVIEYLKAPPTVPELRVLMEQLGIGDPRQMMRTGEDIYVALGLADVYGDALLGAVAAHPVLLERPIVVRDGRAVIARPPELLLELLGPCAMPAGSRLETAGPVAFGDV
jgi:arsenate reductase